MPDEDLPVSERGPALVAKPPTTASIDSLMLLFVAAAAASPLQRCRENWPSSDLRASLQLTLAGLAVCTRRRLLTSNMAANGAPARYDAITSYNLPSPGTQLRMWAAALALAPNALTGMSEAYFLPLNLPALYSPVCLYMLI